ncbi:MAG: SpoIIIAH-like family protein [Clostridiales bacterium]|nr:SpoIIIAH-like family protein [Clostridiales bacterium]
MKKIFKKNQIIITTLAIMIAIAGYLNYSGNVLEESADTVSSDDNTVLLTDEIEENTYVDTYTDIVSLDGDGSEEASVEEEIAADTADASETSGTTDTAAASEETVTTEASVGEAVLASTSVSAASEILASAKLNREQVRAKSKEELQELIDSTDITDDQKQEAVTAMTTLTVNAEKESAAELLLEANGYADCVVSITDDTADVVVNASELTEAQRAQIEDIVKRKTDVKGENIIITPAAAAADTEASIASTESDAAAGNEEEAAAEGSSEEETMAAEDG